MLTPEKIAELKAAHPQGLALVEMDGVSVVFRPPSRAAYDKWRDGSVAEPKSQSEYARELCQGCLVYPSFEDFMSIIDREPAVLCGEMLDACAMLAGRMKSYSVKKL